MSRSGNRARVRGKWENFRRGGGWVRIVPEFQSDGSAFEFSSGPFRFHAPQFANQTAMLEITNEWDIWSRSPITSPAMVFEVTPEGVQPGIAGRIDDNNPSQVWYDDAWGPGLSLRYTVWHGRAPRATREAVIDPARCPRGRDLQASWLVRCPKALTLINGARPKNPDGSDWTGSPGDQADLPATGAALHYFDGQVDPVRGSGFKGPQVWYWKADGTLVTQAATVTAVIVTPDTIRLTKILPQAVVDAADAEGSLVLCDDTQTFYPDPNIELTTWDGYIGLRWTSYTGSNFDVMVTQAATSSSYANDSQMSAALGARSPNYLYRVWQLFDLSSLSGQTISAVTHGCSVTGNANALAYRLTEATTASNTGRSLSDFQNTYNNHDTDLLETDFDFSTTGMHTATYNAAGIAAAQAAVDGTGILKTCVRWDQDNQSAPASPGAFPADQLYLDTAESANDPYIEVTYGAAAAGGSNTAERRAKYLRP